MMITQYLSQPKTHYISVFTGFTDSQPKALHNSLNMKPKLEHDITVTATNAENPVALATEYHMATNKTSYVYFQNNCLGNQSLSRIF